VATPAPDGHIDLHETRPAIPSLRERSVGRLPIGVPIAVLFAGVLIGLCLANTLGLMLGRSSDAVSGAVILGVSIGFAAITVACFILLAARVNAFTNMTDDVTETRRYIDLGVSHASAIRSYGRNAKSPGT